MLEKECPSAWFQIWVIIRLMEEILHHPTCMKPCREWDIYHINWCRISSINSSKAWSSYSSIRVGIYTNTNAPMTWVQKTPWIVEVCPRPHPQTQGEDAFMLLGKQLVRAVVFYLALRLGDFVGHRVWFMFLKVHHLNQSQNGGLGPRRSNRVSPLSELLPSFLWTPKKGIQSTGRRKNTQCSMNW